VKYLKHDPTFNVASIIPENCLGASQLWVFNPKKRILTCYNSKSGIQFKRSSVTNFEENASFEKKLRKPEEILQTILKTTSALKAQKTLEQVKAKNKTPTG